MQSQSKLEVKSEVTHIKTEIISIMNDTDKKSTGYLGFFGGPAPQNETLRIDILAQTDLEDLHFLQYIINELKKPENEKHPYQTTLLPTVEKYKKELMKLSISEFEKVLCGMFFVGGLLRREFLVVAGIAFLFREWITEKRLSRALETQLALKFNHGKMPHLDQYDGSVGMVARMSDGALSTVQKAFEYIPSLRKQG